MEIDKLNEDPDPHMSGAYIRTLVKQLRTKDPMNPNSSSSSSFSVPDGDGGAISKNHPSKMAENQRPHPTQHHKKQVRRRLHTSRPYQERLLNMAEARREIVTALKFHRAAMKKAAADQQLPQTPPEPPSRCQEGKIKPRKIPKSSSTDKTIIYPQNNFAYNTNSNNNNYNKKNLKNFCYPPSNSFPTWSAFQINPQSVANNLDIALPEQTLGLNLNLHDFNNLDANLFAKGSSSVSASASASASSSSSSHSLSIATDQEAPHSTWAASDAGAGSGGGGGGGRGLHVAVGEEEMAEIRSIGEKHEMEWSDKMNLVKSAWWLRFMKMGKGKSKEEEEEEEEEGEGGEGLQFRHPFDQILEFPDWMNDGNQRNFEEQLLNDYCSHDYQFFHDNPALPRMDIGEFEGMDGEWLA